MAAIKEIDGLIDKEEIYHEKEHLVSKKKLYLAYIVTIKEFKVKSERKGEAHD